MLWEVLHGVGADGVGVKFTILAVSRSRFPRPPGEYRKAKKNEKKTEKNEKNEEKREKRRTKIKKAKKEKGKCLRHHLHQPH